MQMQAIFHFCIDCLLQSISTTTLKNGFLVWFTENAPFFKYLMTSGYSFCMFSSSNA